MFDWFTFIAQIVNFLILVWLLKRFFYTPVLSAMDRREKELADLFEQGRANLASAEEKQLDLEEKLEEIESYRETRMEELEQEMEELRSTLIVEARDEVRLLEKSWKDSLARDQERFDEEFKIAACTELLKVVDRMLRDLGDRSFERQMIEKCVDRLVSSNALILPQSGDGRVLVRTSRPVPKREREDIEQRLRALWPGSTEIDFEENESIIAGMELTFNGHKATWTVIDYLNNLESEVAESVYRG
ncbi:MAG: hypothetical protein H6677_14755 [Candidatus Obscuribacterales bacterium]|nr:hypothetical protein [Candidatus Obscuribacterales bacterium]